MNEEILQSFLKEKSERYRPETIKRYHKALKEFFTLYPCNYRDIQENNIRGWIFYMRNHNMKHSTIQAKFTALKSFFKYCLEGNKITEDPSQMIRVHKEEESVPYYLNEEEITFIQNLTKDQPRERAIFEMLYSTGVKINELINIKMEDIHLGKRQLFILDEKRMKWRLIELTTDCVQCLLSYLMDREQESLYLFSQENGEPLTVENIKLLLNRFAIKLEVNFTPFTLRYTYAAEAAKKGVPFETIKEQLGLINKSSEKIYLRIINHVKKKTFKRSEK